MAMDLPVNLMSTVAQLNHVLNPVHSDTTALGLGAVQPAKVGADAQGADSHTARQDHPQQPGFLFQQNRTAAGEQTALDRAYPKSVFAAQTVPVEFNVQNTETGPSQTEMPPRTSEIDRYAPPNPLPTAAILQAATVYAAKRAALEEGHSAAVADGLFGCVVQLA